MRKTWSPPGPLRRALTGIATTVVEGPVGTSTRTEAPGAGAWLWIRARTSALRVAGSTRASTATIRAVMGRGSSAAYTATGSPACSSAATACATVKSTLAAASTPCSVVSSVPSFRYCPGCTRSEEHTSELQSPCNLVCRLLLEKKKTIRDRDRQGTDDIHRPPLQQTLNTRAHILQAIQT